MEKEIFSVSSTLKPSCSCDYCFPVSVSDWFHNTTAADSHIPLIYGNVSFNLKSFAQSHTLVLAKPKVWEWSILWAMYIYHFFSNVDSVFLEKHISTSEHDPFALFFFFLLFLFLFFFAMLTVHSKLSLG